MTPPRRSSHLILRLKTAAIPGWARWGLAAVSGMLLYAAFPSPSLWLCAFAAPGVLAAACAGATARRAFVLGFLAGWIASLLSLWWVVSTLSTHAAFGPWAAMVTLMALSAALAVYVGIFAAAVSILERAFKLAGVLSFPAVWVALEFARTHVLTGFPWNLLGHSQHAQKGLIQIASVTGVYGVSFVCAALSAGFAGLALHGRRSYKAAAVCAGYVVLFVGVPWGWGVRALRPDVPAAGPGIKVACIQANTPQDVKWDPRYSLAIYETHIRMTEEAARQGAEFVIWSESSVPEELEATPWYRAGVMGVARRSGIHVLVGTVYTETAAPPPSSVPPTPAAGEPDAALSAAAAAIAAAAAKAEERYFNCAVLVNPDGTEGVRYDKIHLVPFSEYNPYRRVLFFFPRIVHAASDFTPGTAFTVNTVKGFRYGTLICYEAIFPELARSFTRRGAQILVNITNDAWFGRSAAPEQHFVASIFRAVETRRWVVRSANSGISAVIDPYGRVLGRTGLMEQTILYGRVEATAGFTPYVAYGDVFAWVASAATVALLACALVSLKKTRP